jgi:hypothetical protein
VAADGSVSVKEGATVEPLSDISDAKFPGVIREMSDKVSTITPYEPVGIRFRGRPSLLSGNRPTVARETSLSEVS